MPAAASDKPYSEQATQVDQNNQNIKPSKSELDNNRTLVQSEKDNNDDGGEILSKVKARFLNNVKISKVLNRLEEGSKSSNPYWMNSSKKLTAILNALYEIMEKNSDVNHALKDSNSTLFKATSMQRISFFNLETKSIKIINKEDCVFNTKPV